jgi:integrase
MHGNAHNYSHTTFHSIATLGDLRDFILTCDLKPEKKNQIRSAIKRVDELVGHGALDLPADPQIVFSRLEGISPAMAGVEAGSFANTLTRLRTAFRLAASRLGSLRSRAPLKGHWRTLQETLDDKSKRMLSRLFHFAARQGWQPADMTDAHIERFASHLREEAMVMKWEATVRQTIRAWNRLAASGHGALSPLTLPAPKRTSYWIAPESWPESLRADLEALLSELGNPNLFSGRKVRKLKPGTIAQYRYMISTLVSAATGDGVPLAKLTALAVAVHPDQVVRALNFLAARAGGTITATMMQMMIRVRVIADICQLPEAERAELAAIWENLVLNAPPELQRRHMARKNRLLLDRLGNDQHFADLIQTLPDRLAHEARAKSAPVLMRTAMAIDLLLTCSMRRENLVSLELGKSIKRVGQPPNHRWIVDLTPEEVKNEQPLRYRIEGPTAALLEDYLAHWRPKLCDKPNGWLFPGPDGNAIDPKTMALAIQTQSRRVLGVSISPHQFRHISAESFLLAHPDKLDLISEHLGHRDRNTTRLYYARSKQKQASRIYHEHALKMRQEATRRLAQRSRKRRPSGEEREP